MERLVREVGEQVVARIGANTDMDNIDAVARCEGDSVDLYRYDGVTDDCLPRQGNYTTI
jgi:hypothetical protein